MLSAIVRFAVHRRGVVIALALLLLVYGVLRLGQASLDIFPEFSAPRIVIQTEAPGLTAEQTETLVTSHVEKQLAGLIGLDSIRSESIQGLSVATVVFEEGTDIYRNRQLVGERLSLLAGKLPPGAGPPVMVPLSSSSATVLTIGLSSPSHSLMELRDLVDWTIVPRILAVPGVADVNVFGGEIRQLQIQIDPDKLRRYGLAAGDVVLAARQATGMPGAGFVENHNQRIVLNIAGLPAAEDALKQVVLMRRNGANITLADVATVATAPRPPIGAAAVGGKPAVVMMVIAQYGANTLRVSRNVGTVLGEFEQLFSKQAIDFHPHLFRPADYIERSLSNLAAHLLAGGLLVVLVLYVFLFDFRTAFISAIAIPLSLVAAVVALLNLGVNLNIMILGGLAIALGEVVDDAIIDTENIFRRLRENRLGPNPRPVFQIVYQASMEVRSSVVYASFIVALAFVPLLTLGGIAGRLFAPIGYAYILAILMSLLVALTVTPALCYMLLKTGKTDRAPPLIRLLQPRYAALLRSVAQRPKAAAWISAAVCGSGFLALTTLGGEFLPQLREGHYIVHTSSLPGTSLNESLRIGGLLTRQFLAMPEVESVSQWAGRAERGADTYGSHYSEYEVRLKPLSGEDQQAVLERLRRVLGDFPGILFEANTFLTERIDETISGYTAPVVINLYGTDLDLLDRKAREVAGLIRTIPGAIDVQLRSPPSTPQLQIRLKLDELAGYGLRPLEVADVLQTALQGRVAGTYYLDNRAYEVAVILPPDLRRRPEAIAHLPLRTADGLVVELGRIADIRQVGGRYNILHQGGQRVQTITANVTGRAAGTFMEELRRRTFDVIDFPPEIYPEFTGAAVEQGKARWELTIHALLAGTGVLLLVFLAVDSVRHMFLALINLPFSLAGGVAAAVLAGATLSIGSMVGFVTLFGITVRNSIMLISHYRHLVEIENCPWNLETAIRGAQERLPSILMTALVTALAMLPIAVDSDNPGREIMGPMAAIIIGGLVSSTILNLLLLPTILLKFGRFETVGRRQ
ncbi:RND efflux transporter HME family, translocase subunit [Methylocaldum marinum]|uniref:RND efflux transporter HME family, translocase subunit n=1 Tax=Methylocaldum marinum TaxID=1432792 RepID=A0A250KLP0_9GAMM|nr:efflux RND transporter permease subunit [Methylocaldum marinum]BBA32650.1 RND efflux transporter HME family, translocase subunit [Methylocaldum marinum]